MTPLDVTDGIELPDDLVRTTSTSVSLGNAVDVPDEEQARRKQEEADAVPKAPGEAVAPVIEFRRADGTTYQEPPGKNVSTIPLKSIVIQVDADNNPVEGSPRYSKQFKDPRWRNTWRLGAIEWLRLSMLVPEDVKRLNELEQGTRPAGCPAVVILKRTCNFHKPTGDYVWLLCVQKVIYYEVLSTS